MGRSVNRNLRVDNTSEVRTREREPQADHAPPHEEPRPNGQELLRRITSPFYRQRVMTTLADPNPADDSRWWLVGFLVKAVGFRSWDVGRLCLDCSNWSLETISDVEERAVTKDILHKPHDEYLRAHAHVRARGERELYGEREHELRNVADGPVVRKPYAHVRARGQEF